MDTYIFEQKGHFFAFLSFKDLRGTERNFNFDKNILFA